MQEEHVQAASLGLSPDPRRRGKLFIVVVISLE